MIRWAAEHPLSCLMLHVALMVWGVVSLTHMSVDALPSLGYPKLIVETTLSGVTAPDVERLVTVPLEQRVSTVPRLVGLHSSSRPGISTITARFAWGTNMDYAALKVRQAAEEARPSLPAAAGQPVVRQYDPQSRPVMQICAADPAGAADLSRMAEQVWKPRLEQIEGVGLAEVVGIHDREINVAVDPVRTESFGVPVADLATTLKNWTSAGAGGQVESQGARYPVSYATEFTQVEQLGRVPLRSRNGALLSLDELAEIRMISKERDKRVTLNGAPAIDIEIYKEWGSNTVTVSRLVREELERLKQDRPATRWVVLHDDADFIRDSLASLKQALMLGGALAMLVLFLFLGANRAPFLMAISIPVSLLYSIIPLWYLGTGLNLMTLGGMSIAAGMLVDNGIVVVENIRRRREAGADPVTAAAEGTREIATPLIVSTLTTVAVFLPIAYLQGVEGILYKQQAYAVAAGLLASLLVSLTLIPSLASGKFGSAHSPSESTSTDSDAKTAPVLSTSGRLYGRLSSVMALFLAKPWLAGSLAATLLILGACALYLLPTELAPRTQSKEIEVRIETDAEYQSDSLQTLGRHLSTTLIGTGRQGVVLMVAGPTDLRYLIRLPAEADPLREVDTITSSLPSLHGCRIGVTSLPTPISALLATDAAAVQVRVTGEDWGELERLATQVRESLRNEPGLTNVKLAAWPSTRVMEIKPHEDAMEALRLSPPDTAEAISNLLETPVVTWVEDGHMRTPVRLLPMGTISPSWDLLSRTSLGVGGSNVADRYVQVGDIVGLGFNLIPNEITRESQERSLEVAADLHGVPWSLAAARIEPRLESIPRKAGYGIRLAGEKEAVVASFKELRWALLLAVLLVFLLLTGEFESLKCPLLVIATMPVAFSGSLLALLLTGQTLNMMSLIGLINLVGVCDNEAVLKLDCILRLRKEGVGLRDAVVRASKIRLRSTLLTIGTTIAGILPLALPGFGSSSLQTPMAIAILGGMITTAITILLLLPAAYLRTARA